MRSALIVLFISSVVCSQASAGFLSGNDIYGYCSSSRALVNGFAAGVFDKGENDYYTYFSFVWEAMDHAKDPVLKDRMSVKSAEGTLRIAGYCEPKNIILNQVSDVFCRYLNNHPETRHKSAAELFTIALTEAWPCSNKN